MEIKVRNLESNTVLNLDSLAKEQRESREKFLKKKLEEIAFKDKVEAKENEYKELLKTVTDAITLNTKILGAFMEEYLIDGEDAYNLVIDNPYRISTFDNKLSHIDNKSNEIDKRKNALIRDVPIYILDRVDELAKERNLSRSEYVTSYLRQLTYSNTLKLVDKKYTYMLEKALGILDFNSRIFKLFHDENIIDISKFINEGEN